MTTPTCTLPAEDLVAYADGYLTGARRELVEAHLAICLHCQARIQAFEDVDRLLREGSPPIDDPAGRAMVRARLEREDGRHRSSPRRLLMVPVLLLLVALVLVAGSPPGTEAGFPLGRFIRFAAVEVKQWLPANAPQPLQHVAPSNPDVTAPAFQAVMPAQLPHDLVLVEQSLPTADRLEMLYRNHTDLTLLVIESPARPGIATLGTTTERGVSVVRGTEVVLTKDPRPDAVSALYWERKGIFFGVLVIESPLSRRGGLKQADALQIVEALIAAQDTAQG